MMKEPVYFVLRKRSLSIISADSNNEKDSQNELIELEYPKKANMISARFIDVPF